MNEKLSRILPPVYKLILPCVALVLASSVNSKEASTPQAGGVSEAATKPDVCELHIWPTDNLNVGSVGSTASKHGNTEPTGIIPAAFSGKNGAYQEILSKLLNKEGQIEALRKAEPAQLFQSKPNTVVLYHVNMPFSNMKNKRNVQSSSSCYSEIKVDNVMFNHHPLYGKDILAFFTYRDFGNDATVDISKSVRARRKIEKFSLEVDRDSPAAIAAIQTAFIDDFKEFAKRVTDQKER